MIRPFVLLAALSLCSCQDSAYNAASKVDTVEAWRRFLQANPKDARADAAHQRLGELEFEQAKKTHTVVGYKRFLDEFSTNDEAPTARKLLEGLRFNAAVAQPSASAWRRFLRDHPDGPHHDEAEKQLAAAELTEVSSLNDPAALAKLAAESPDDRRSLEATAKLDEVEWLNVVSAAQAYAYLRERPAGTHRDDAKTRLLSLQVEGLLVSGLIEVAQALAKKSPLASKLPDLGARVQKAKAMRALATARDERIRRALPGYYLRAVDDLLKALQSPDPLDQWEAAEELGFHVTVRAIDPLLETVRTARSPLVRQKAFDSLSSVLRSLPQKVAEYEVATRVEALGTHASDAQLYLSTAVLLDVTGQLQRAAIEYQRAWDAALPDPVVLRRWALIRRERREFFSSAVAARQLAVWAAARAANAPQAEGTNALSAARDMCAAVDAAVFAKRLIEQTTHEKTEFPEDLEVFLLRAHEAEQLANAKLRDAELALLTQNETARRCGDSSVRSRFDDAVNRRIRLVAELKQRPTKETVLLLDVLNTLDPSPEVREAAKAGL